MTHFLAKPLLMCLDSDIGNLKFFVSLFKYLSLDEFLIAPWEMDIFIYYRGKVVIHEIVTMPTGCRLHYGDANLQLIAKQTHQLPSGVFGSDSLHQVRFLRYTCASLCLFLTCFVSFSSIV